MISDMTDDEIRMAMAKASNWTPVAEGIGASLSSNEWTPIWEGAGLTDYWLSPQYSTYPRIPYYASDLNAMYKAIIKMDGNFRERVRLALCDMCDDSTNAHPRMRAEAFLMAHKSFEVIAKKATDSMKSIEG